MPIKLTDIKNIILNGNDKIFVRKGDKVKKSIKNKKSISSFDKELKEM